MEKSSQTSKDDVRKSVRERYAGIALSSGSTGCGCSPSCCSSGGGVVNAAMTSTELGYSLEDVKSVPEGSDMGLGCGNPQTIASLKAGEAVVDLGSGGGFDCFLAANKVGKSGKVIGIDMTPEMISKARRNAEKGGYENVEFRLGEIEYLPVADCSVDVVMSNCVINLSPDKQRVYNEAFRVLKAGGRLAISDVVATSDIPDKLKNDKEELCSCISGAASKTEIEKMLKRAGFTDILVELKPDSREFIKDWAPGSGVENHVCSALITAKKTSIKNQEV